MTRRMPKVDDLIQSEVAELLQREVKHPALQDALVSITRVETSPDLRSSRVFVSVMGPEGDDGSAVLEALDHSEPFLHRELMKRLHMRRVPRIRFILDRSIAEGDRISALMREVAQSEGRTLPSTAAEVMAAGEQLRREIEEREAAELEDFEDDDLDDDDFEDELDDDSDGDDFEDDATPRAAR